MGFASQRHALPNPSHPPVATTTQYTLSLLTQSLPGAQIGVAYSATLQATGGVPPYTWSIIAGALPPGLTMDSNGNITGTPTTIGTYNFTVQFVDPIGNFGTVNIGVSL
jgi:large repetitive protein